MDCGSLGPPPDKTGWAKVDGPQLTEQEHVSVATSAPSPPLPLSPPLPSQPKHTSQSQSFTAHTLTRERGAKVSCLDSIESNIRVTATE